MGQIKNIKLHIVTDIRKNITVHIHHGEHSKNQKNVLQGNKMPQTHPPQGDAVQSCQEKNVRQRAETLRTETVGIRWTNSSHSSQESEDHEENCAENGVF